MAFWFGNGLRGNLEDRRPVRHHGNADAAGQRLDRIAVAQAEPGVHSVERSGIQVVDHFQAHDDGQVSFPDGSGQVPFGPVIDIGQCRRERGERGCGVATAVAQPLDEGPRADVIVPERELMGPGLKGVLPVPVHDHVLRQVLHTKPALRVGLQGLGGEAVQQGEALLHPAAEVPRRGLGFRVDLVREQGGHEQHQGDGKDRHSCPEPYEAGLTHGDRALP